MIQQLAVLKLHLEVINSLVSVEKVVNMAWMNFSKSRCVLSALTYKVVGFFVNLYCDDLDFVSKLRQVLFFVSEDIY